MTIIDNPEIRSETQQFYIQINREQLNNAIRSKLLFTVDEYIVSIFNTFFSDGRSITEDKILLNELIKYSEFLGNDRNAKIIKLELKNVDKKLNSKPKNDLTFPLKVIFVMLVQSCFLLKRFHFEVKLPQRLNFRNISETRVEGQVKILLPDRNLGCCLCTHSPN